MKLGLTRQKIKQMLIALGITAFVVVFFTGLVDVVAPIRSGVLSHCAFRTLFGQCVRYVDFYKLFLVIVYFLVGSLLVQLPIFWLFGFKTQAKIWLAVKAVVLTVALYQLCNFVFDGISTRIGQILVIVVASAFLVSRLKTEMSKEKVVLAVVVASLTAYSLQMILGNFLLLPMPFFSY